MDYVKSLQLPAIRTAATTGAVALMSYGISKCAMLASYGVSFPVDIYAASGIAAAANAVNHAAIYLFKTETAQKLPACLRECKITPAFVGTGLAVAAHAGYTSAEITKETGILFLAIATVTAIANHFPRTGKEAAAAKVEATA